MNITKIHQVLAKMKDKKPDFTRKFHGVFQTVQKPMSFGGVPSGTSTWLARKSPIAGGFNETIGELDGGFSS